MSTAEESWQLTAAARARLRAEHPCSNYPRVRVRITRRSNMSITAKVKVTGKTPLKDGQTSLYFGADYSNNRNKEWSKYTPSLQLSMTVLNSVAEQFQVGQPFTLIFTPDVASEALSATNHPDDVENELADDAEVDALIEGISLDDLVLSSEDNV